MIKVVFFSSSERALPILETLQKKFELLALVSPPSVADTLATKSNFFVLKTTKLGPKEISWIISKKPDIMVSAYFGLYIPEKLVNFNKLGIINIHPSLLPRWRGPSPVQAAIATGDKITGVTFIKMDEEFDHGPILAQIEEKIKRGDTQESLYKRLFKVAAETLPFILTNYCEGKLSLTQQNHAKATYCKIIKKEDGYIKPQVIKGALEGNLPSQNFSIPFIKDSSVPLVPEILERYIRALSPWPGVYTWIVENPKSKIKKYKRLKILKAHIEKDKLALDDVQLEGKKPVIWKQFRQGYPHFEFCEKI